MGATYSPLASASFSTTAFPNVQPLLSSGDDVVSRSGTVASGIGVLKRGTICKIVPATGVITVGATAAEANCILAEDVDATSATKAALVYLSGQFKADALTWPGALAHADVSDALRNYGILVESVVYTDGTLVKSFATAQEEAAGRAVVEQNRADLASRAAGTPTAPAETKPVVDSPWAYLTPEERANNPELAAMPTTQELAGAIPDVPGVTISPTSETVLASGGSGSINVTITSPGTSGTWTVEPEASATWLTFSPTTPQSADGTVTWTAAANSTGQPRAGHCYINGKTFTCNQGAV